MGFGDQHGKIKTYGWLPQIMHEYFTTKRNYTQIENLKDV